MRILAILLLLAFGGGAYMLSRYVENSMNERARYGNDDLIRAIRINNELHRNGVPLEEGPQANTTKQVIQFGGGVDTVPIEDPGSQHTTYFKNEVPSTNEGQPGQPLPLTGQAPINPVYK